jgi:hypothetical protein
MTKQRQTDTNCGYKRCTRWSYPPSECEKVDTKGRKDCDNCNFFMSNNDLELKYLSQCKWEVANF